MLVTPELCGGQEGIGTDLEAELMGLNDQSALLENGKVRVQ